MNAPFETAKFTTAATPLSAMLETLAAGSEDIVAVCNDSVGSSKLGGIQKKCSPNG